MKQRDLIAGGIVVLIMGGAFLAFGSASKRVDKPACTNTVLQTLPSPDQKNKAIIFARDCGSGANVSMQVSILPTAANLTNEPGNVYVADLPGGKKPYVEFHWHAADGGEVVSDPSARVYKKNDFIGDIVVTFREGF